MPFKKVVQAKSVFSPTRRMGPVQNRSESEFGVREQLRRFPLSHTFKQQCIEITTTVDKYREITKSSGINNGTTETQKILHW